MSWLIVIVIFLSVAGSIGVSLKEGDQGTEDVCSASGEH